MRMVVLSKNGAGGVFVMEGGKLVKKRAGEVINVECEQMAEGLMAIGRARPIAEGAGETVKPTRGSKRERDTDQD